MFRLILLIGVLLSQCWSAPDLIPTFGVTKIGTSGALDVIEIFTVVNNIGTSNTPIEPSAYVFVGIGLDSLTPLRSHNMPAGSYLGAGNFVYFLDTIQVIPGIFSINVYADPIKIYDGYSGNNVRSQAYNFHPTIQQIHDTTVVYDTLHDTLKVVEWDTVSITLHDTTRVSVTDTIFQRDTIRVVVRDTLVKKDTVKYCPPTLLAKVSFAALATPVPSVVYNAAGVKVWEGMLPPGGYPPAGLRPGLHLIVQRDKARRFRVAYR